MGIVPGRAVLLVLAGWLALAGCGDRNPTAQDRARAAALTFVQSCAHQEPARAADLMTDSLRATFIRAGPAAQACARFLGIDPAGKDEAALASAVRAVSVESVTVRGGAASATLRAPGGGRARLGLGYTEGEWQVDTAPAGT